MDFVELSVFPTSLAHTWMSFRNKEYFTIRENFKCKSVWILWAASPSLITCPLSPIKQRRASAAGPSTIWGMEILKKSMAHVWYLTRGLCFACCRNTDSICGGSGLVVVTVPSLANRNVFSSWGESLCVLGYRGSSGELVGFLLGEEFSPWPCALHLCLRLLTYHSRSRPLQRGDPDLSLEPI